MAGRKRVERLGLKTPRDRFGALSSSKRLSSAWGTMRSTTVSLKCERPERHHRDLLNTLSGPLALAARKAFSN